jgi:hypothetical protein
MACLYYVQIAIIQNASKEHGLQVNTDITKYMFMSRYQNPGQNWNMKRGNKASENAIKFKDIRMTVTDHIHNENKHNLSSGNDSSVGIALGYEPDYRGSRVRFLEGAGNFSLHHSVQNGSGAHPASYPMGTRGSFPGDKAAGA